MSKVEQAGMIRPSAWSPYCHIRFTLRRVIFNVMSITPLDYLTFRVMRRYFLFHPFFCCSPNERRTPGRGGKDALPDWLARVHIHRGRQGGEGGKEVLYIHEAFIRLIWLCATYPRLSIWFALIGVALPITTVLLRRRIRGSTGRYANARARKLSHWF